MHLRSPRARRRPSAGIARAGAVAIIALCAAACSDRDDAVDGGAVPTLLTSPVQASSSSSSSINTTTTTVVATNSEPATTPPPTEATSSTIASAPIDDTGTPSGPAAAPDPTASTEPESSTSSSTMPATGATSTTADIEPPPPSLASTAPIPTAAQPPDTIGGRDVDFLLAPRAIAGLQFGASRSTVLDRLSDLLGDPRQVVTLANCPGGPGTALQWFNASVIVTNRGLAYYIVGMNVADYEDKPVPGWHTTAGLEIGADRARLDEVYPQQLTYGTPAEPFTPFTVTAGGDSGLKGQLEGDVVHTISSGAPIC